MDDFDRVLALADELASDELMGRLRREAAARRAAEASAERQVEISRLRMLAPGHNPEHLKACAGPVSLYEPDDPRRRDCLANWQVPGLCVCGCGAGRRAPRRAPRRALRRNEDLPLGDALAAGLIGTHLESAGWSW